MHEAINIVGAQAQYVAPSLPINKAMSKYFFSVKVLTHKSS